MFRGGNRKGILACCILYACYDMKCSKTREEIAKQMMISKNNIIKGEPIFNNIIRHNSSLDISNKSVNVSELFSTIINKLGLPFKFYVSKCIEIYKLCEEDLSEISSNASIAGCVTYVIHNIKKEKKPTKKRIISVVGITNPTLSNSLKIIKSIIEE